MPMSSPRRKDDPNAVAADFRPPAAAIEDRAPPPGAGVTLRLAAGVLASAVVWASVSRVDEIAVAPGKLVTTRPNLVIQPLERSVIRGIHVTIGDTVKAGEPLITLDTTFSDADVEQLKAKLAHFDALLVRLEAEAAERPMAIEPDAAGELQLQYRLHRQKKAAFEAKLADLDQQIARAEAGLATSLAEEDVNRKRLATLTEIEEMRTTLLDRQSGSRLNLLQSRDLRLDIESAIARAGGQRKEMTHGLAKARAEKQAFIEDSRRTTLEQLVEARDQRKTALEELRKAELRRNLVTLTAPADGVVLDIAQRSLGSVMKEAEPLVTLVPLDVPIEAEVSVDARDIGRVAAGQSVRVKLDAFPFQKHGTAEGTVRTISRDAFSPQQQERQAGGVRDGLPFYRVRVSLDAVRLRGLPGDLILLPGMTVSGEIRTGRRTVISYFLYPIMKGLDESLREP
jgi:hemolysin D